MMRGFHLLALALVLLMRTSTYAAMPVLTLVPQEPVARFEPAYFGIHVHNNGTQRNWPDIPVGSLRLWDAAVTWAYLEAKPNQFDFDRLDMYVDWAQRNGVEILMPLGLPPRWASARPDEPGAYGPGSAAEPGSMRTWRGYVRAVAERYRGRIAAYEVWNEVNETAFYSGSTDMLVKLVVAATEEIREADPAARMVAPSAVGFDDRVGWPSRFLRSGARSAVDAISFHFYHTNGAPESMIEPLQRMRAINVAAGYGDLELWNTEAGYWMPNTLETWSEGELRNRISEEQAVAYLPRDLVLARVLGARRYHWYAWDGGKMGLLDPARPGRHRPAGDVYGQAIRLLRNTTIQRCSRDGDGLWTCQLRNATGQPLQAFWMDPAAPKQERLLETPAQGRWIKLDGASDWQSLPAKVMATPIMILVGESP